MGKNPNKSTKMIIDTILWQTLQRYFNKISGNI